ncbi:hypothetical protein PCANC_26513 [Puccinia coronata f. sp. avenae]|uniref:Uncharacterized protein n=1 Tax=Puccinia coronata f. sp. avenae TaxID=200324 RepID=A0A2N5TJ27_9BASI|nr:hypothetical protein PCANC_26513 [Puccinia coronata f. sp. avenae]
MDRRVIKAVMQSNKGKVVRKWTREDMARYRGAGTWAPAQVRQPEQGSLPWLDQQAYGLRLRLDAVNISHPENRSLFPARASSQPTCQQESWLRHTRLQMWAPHSDMYVRFGEPRPLCGTVAYPERNPGFPLISLAQCTHRSIHNATSVRLTQGLLGFTSGSQAVQAPSVLEAALNRDQVAGVVESVSNRREHEFGKSNRVD